MNFNKEVSMRGCENTRIAAGVLMAGKIKHAPQGISIREELKNVK